MNVTSITIPGVLCNQEWALCRLKYTIYRMMILGPLYKARKTEMDVSNVKNGSLVVISCSFQRQKRQNDAGKFH